MFLDDGTRRMLCALLSISAVTADTLWTVTGQLVWTGQALPEVIQDEDIESLIQLLKTGDDEGPLVRSAISLHPPQFHCIIDVSCDICHRIKEAEQNRIVVYTRARGTLPGTETKLYCRDCHTVYYHNYSTHKGQRRYYGGIPSYLQVASHIFLEKDLIEHFALSMTLV